jgi:2,3-bisphosphoglycerate-independent phosphoglycerate mutase
MTDGRDVADKTSPKYAAAMEADLDKLRAGGMDVKAASGGGRMFITMDRYECDWPMVKRGWDAHVLGQAPHQFGSYLEAVTELGKVDGNPGSDQHLPPFVITEGGKPVGTIEDGDAVVLVNFRADRMVQLSQAFEYENFNKFDRVRFPKVKFAGMMQYDGDLLLPANYLVDAPSIGKVSGQYLIANGIKTWACSETQKFGHVTFFWNGNKSGYLDETMEEYHLIESDKVVFDEKPAMKAREITDAAMAAIKSGKYEMIRVNYANPDMVGHTGNLAATISACETCDGCLGELLACIESVGGRWLVTSDHGNADDMVQRAKKTNAPIVNKETGEVDQHKAHTLAPVPVCIGGNLPAGLQFKPGLEKAGLANVTGTFINLLGLSAPRNYEESLI